MSTQNNTIEKNDIKKSYQEFNKILTVLLIIGIIIISGFIIYAVLTPEPGYVNFGVLNSDRKAENYPKNATVGENVTFYASVGNYLNRDFSFRVEILTGNNETILSPYAPALNAISYMNSSIVELSHREKWISNAYNVLFLLSGYDQLIIVEFWENRDGSNDKYWEIFWMYLNVTS